MTEFLMTQGRTEALAVRKVLDSAHYATCVRQLALDANRLFRDPFTSARDLVELSQRIDDLWLHCPGHPSASLDRWMRNAQDLVDGRETLHD